MKVAVCVCTLHRPLGLERLLEALGRLTFRGPAPEVEVVVVDNDPAGSAGPVCREAREALPWPLRWCVEAERGIPQARNRAIREAGDADCLAFIDDDEVPSPEWLDELLAVMREHDADAVAGPVLPRFEGRVARWLEEGGFFDRPRAPTGTPVEYVGTGNVLFRGALLRSLSPAFDPSLALTGGSDTHLSIRLARRGAKMVWADRAEVTDYVPESRATGRWLLQRSFRSGMVITLAERDVDPSARALATRLAKAFGRVLHGAALLPPSALRGRAAALRALRSASRGVGMLAGTLGVRYQEYRKIHGA